MSFANTTFSGLTTSSARSDIALWGSAALVVLAVHVGGGWYLSRSLDAPEEMAAVEEAMLVDLTPMLETSPDSVESETLTEEPATEMAVAEEVVEAETPVEQTPVTEEAPSESMAEEITPVEPEPVEPTPVEPEITEPEPVEPEPVEPDLADPEPVEPDVVTEEVIDVPTVALPDTDVPLPVSRPEPPREIVKERPARREPVREQPRRTEPRREEPRQPQRRVTQEARPQPRSQASTQQRASSAPRVSSRRWNSQVASRVQRAAQRAIRRIRGTGTVQIAFTVNGSGAVSNVRVARSSGNPEIDAAVASAVRGISLPATPDGTATPVTIPVLKSR